MNKKIIKRCVSFVLLLVLTISLLPTVPHFAEAAGYTVTFKDGSTVISTVNVQAGEKVESIQAPQKEGMLFAGWIKRNLSNSNDASAIAGYAFDFSKGISSNTTLYAAWIEVGTGKSGRLYLEGVQHREAPDAAIRFISHISDTLVNDLLLLNTKNSVIRPASESQKDIGYGTVLTFAENLADGSLLTKDNEAERMRLGHVVVPAVLTYKYEYGARLFTALVTDIPESGYAQHIAARPYITYADVNGNEQTYYYVEKDAVSHKTGGAYYINYNEAVKNAVDNDAISVNGQPPVQEPETTAAPSTEAVPETPAQPETVEQNKTGTTIYFYADDFKAAYMWYWNGSTGSGYSTTWPGVAYTRVSAASKWWKISVSQKGFSGYVQESGGGRGCDKSFSTPNAYGTYFVVYKNDKETLYTSQTLAENAAGETISQAPIVTEAPAPPHFGVDDDGWVVGYNVPADKTKSSDVTMTSNGVNVGVFDTTVNNSHSWVGYYPPLSSARCAIMDFDGTATASIKVKGNINSVTIRPIAEGIVPVITHDAGYTYINFNLTQAGQYSIELDGNLENTIMLFAGEIEDEPRGNVIKVSSGEAVYKNITVNKGQTLYIEGGGAVYGRVFLKSGSSVCGRGIVDQSHMDTWGGSNGQYPMAIENADDVHVSGISVLNSSCWNYQIYNSTNVYLDNIKIVSARPNGDGISIQSSSNVYVNDSFVRTWDDGIVLKNYSAKNTHDVYCDNIVFWTDLAQSMEIGFETNAGYGGTNSAPAIYNVEFTNIDVIHARHKAAISIHNGDNADVYNIKWENVNIEDFTACGDAASWNYWLDFTTYKASSISGASSSWTHNWSDASVIHDVILKNIKVTNNSNARTRRLDYKASRKTGNSIYNITCEGVTVNGQPINY